VRLAALRARTQKRETKLERIMESARNRGSITNDDIVRMLHVSDKSATRYANILVVRGKLARNGKGRGTRYAVVQ
jgi:predicted HTH transcriptional regulator